MPVITIDNKRFEVAEGTTVLQAALDNGIYIPHYCWHPILSVSGNCRMCVVEVGDRPKPEISCNLVAVDGMVIRTDTPDVIAMRRDVLEFLLINHPLDCPICDQAGECLLQDFHFKYSGKPSRFREEKIHKPKVVDIGRHIKMDNERCVLCTRCVRFCHEVSRTSELCVVSRGDSSFVTTAPGGRLDNPYSLNTVDVCPVGALTSKDFRFKKRVWFLKKTPSVCPYCANGCKIWIDHDGGRMYRWRPREAILCDEGRLSYKEWQTEARLKSAFTYSNGELVRADAEILIRDVKAHLSETRHENIVGIVSAQTSCEDIDAFLEFFKRSRIYQTGRVVPDGTEDNIIRKADKNPNTTYLRQKGVEELPADVNGEVLFVVGSLNEDDMLKTAGLQWKFIVQIIHDMSLIMPGANVVLPSAAFTETTGTFVNFAGAKQKFERVFEPQGEARGVKKWLARLS